MKKEQPLSLSKLILSSILNLFFSSLYSNQKIIFPDKIGVYNFKKQIRISKRNSKGSKMFFYAQYQNSKGQKAFAKMWSGKLKNLNYYSLRNEANLYMGLNRVIKRIDKSMPKKFEDITIPQFIATLETKNSLILLTQFIESIQSPKIKPRKRFENYLRTFDFLNFLGDRLSAKEKEQIAIRDNRTIILLYLPLLLKSIFTHPQAFFSLVLGVSVFLRSIPSLLKIKEVTLNHRDLHLENIVMSKNEIVLLDLQFCLLSNSLYDRLTTLRMHWMDREFRQRLLREIRNIYGKKQDFDILIRGLMVHAATHGLTGGNYTKLIIKNFIDYLNFAIKPSSQI